MKKKSKHNINEEVSYWQSGTDVLAALLMIVLLILMILLLYLMKMPENTEIDPSIGDQTSTEVEDEESYPEGYGDPDVDHSYDATEPTHDPGDWDDPDHGGGGGNGGDGPNIGIYDGTGPGEGLGKTAVYVMIVDAQTHHVIKEEGVTFELHIFNQLKKEWQLMVLNTYYPVEIEYRNYKTTEEGIFFLPEKVFLGDYKFHELTAPYGYEIREDFEFPVDEGRDWNEPIIVTIPLEPIKNYIRIQMNDQETKSPLTDGTFYVVAAEDIITLDGTLRYRKGEIVDEIKCDENGYGESGELFLGNYELQQHNIPEYYGAVEKPIPVEVKQKVAGILPKLNQIWCDKTTFTIEVKDELFANIPIVNGNFSISYYLGNVRTDYYDTNEFGDIRITNLAKDTTYHVKQLTTMEGYSLSPIELEIRVDELGHIGGVTTKNYDITNRMLRAKFSVKDKIVGGQVSDKNVTLFDENGNVVTAWDSTGMAHSVEGMLKPGNYYLLINGRESSKKTITIQDIKDIQEYTVAVWTNKSITALLLIGLFLILLIIFLIWYFIRHRDEIKEKRKAKKEAKKQKKEAKLREKEEKKRLQEAAKEVTADTTDKKE